MTTEGLSYLRDTNSAYEGHDAGGAPLWVAKASNSLRPVNHSPAGRQGADAAATLTTGAHPPCTRALFGVCASNELP
jgi:hypothetical protein